MDGKILASVCKQVYQKFPEVKGSQPKIKDQPGDSMLLIFEGVGVTVDGKSIKRTVRAVVNGSGKITKLTTSR